MKSDHCIYEIMYMLIFHVDLRGVRDVIDILVYPVWFSNPCEVDCSLIMFALSIYHSFIYACNM